MPRFFKDRKKTKGLAPGSLVFIGNKKMDQPLISVMCWTQDELLEDTINDPQQIEAYLQKEALTWINIYGIHDEVLIQNFGERLNIPSLLLEDIMNTDQRPRFDDGESGQGFILKSLEWHEGSTKIINDQVSFIAGPNYVISFQEKKANIFEPVRERIRNAKGRIRSAGSDYLVYALLDTLVDNYLDIIGQMGEKIEELGATVLTNPSKDLAAHVYQFKIEMSVLRKCVRPVKELILQWLKSDSGMLQKKTKTYVTDLADLITQAEESIEIYNNLLADGLNIYNTTLSNRANEIMKVLTIFAAIFIPLTFLAGIYGMNFEYIPELGFHYSYPIFWGVVIIVGVGLFLYFRKKNWL